MRISVIIPTLNEASIISKTLNHLVQLNPYEVIVADAKSDDQTCEIAREAYPGLKLAPIAKGRASQMNQGARVANGDILLFLHADTTLPKNAFKTISDSMLSNPNAVGGRFRVSFDSKKIRYRCIAFYTRYPFFSYGDQAFYVKKEIFGKLNGFDEDVPFEDVDFYKRLRREGKTLISKDSVTTSSRRFEKVGFFRQKLANVGLSLLWGAGLLPQNRFKRMYPEVR